MILVTAIFGSSEPCKVSSAGCGDESIVAIALIVALVIGVAASVSFFVYRRWERGPWPLFQRLIAGGWRRQ